MHQKVQDVISTHFKAFTRYVSFKSPYLFRFRLGFCSNSKSSFAQIIKKLWKIEPDSRLRSKVNIGTDIGQRTTAHPHTHTHKSATKSYFLHVWRMFIHLSFYWSQKRYFPFHVRVFGLSEICRFSSNEWENFYSSMFSMIRRTKLQKSLTLISSSSRKMNIFHVFFVQMCAILD